MGKISVANLKKTIYYLKRNGLKNTWYAARERLSERRAAPYVYICPSEEALGAQRERVQEGMRRGEYDGISFSIVVPAYRTDPEYLIEMITSVIKQSYPYWELIIADATEDDSVKEVVEACIKQKEDEHQDVSSFPAILPGSIRYVRLAQNGGISENTNQALEYVAGDYVGLLDHDDLLTPDALYEMAEHIRAAKGEGWELQLLYSDEDKCNRDASKYYEPHSKEKFNLDLILSNNYICHFMVMSRDLIQKLKFRREYEGAQDYDLVLRVVGELQVLSHPDREALICHIPKVLYHWRCHVASTAENPRSKSYAYEAGMRALEDFADCNGLEASVAPLRHVGFYQLLYRRGPLESRKDLGVVGGRIIVRGRIAGGRMDGEGNLYYRGLPAGYSGYMHRAVLTQDAEAVDIRCLAVRKNLRGLFEEVVGVPYKCLPGEEYFDVSALPRDADYREISLKLCEAVRKRGYRILWLPSISNEKLPKPGKR